MTTVNKMLQAGDKAPAFSLADQDGNVVDVGEKIGKKALAVYFYPKDFTAGCTLEAHEFRDMHEEFQRNGAEVIGVSGDSPETHRQFRQENKLPFNLLSDPEDRVRDLYGAWSVGHSPGRVTYLIDKQGVIRMVFSSVIQPKKHSHEAMRVLQEINRD